MSYSTLRDSDKQRLAAVFVNTPEQRSLMSKVDCDSATLDFDPAGKISGASFKTSISRMKRDYSKLSPSDKNRMAACIANIEEDDLKTIMTNVDWKKAATDFQPSGKITAASFRTSIQRMFKPKDNAAGASVAKTTGKKRKAPAAAARSSSSSPSESTPSRKKKAKATQALAEDDAAVPTIEENTALPTSEKLPPSTEEDPLQSDLRSRESSRYMTPMIKAERIDEDVYGGDEASLDNLQFFAE